MNIHLTDFPTLQIEPGEKARQKIELLEQRKAMAAMTPEDYAKRLEAAQKEAEAALAQKGPEDSAQKPAGTANTTPKFCPNCGTPTNGAKFCSSCGTKL